MKGFVYLITRNDDLKYIGITYDVAKRMSAHKKTKRFAIGIKNIEILKEYDDHLVGAVYQNEKYFGTSWNKQGTCIQTKGFGYINMDLTPIKKPWYETCKFPALVWDEDNDLLVTRTRGEYTASYLNACNPLTNDEIEGLKQ